MFLTLYVGLLINVIIGGWWNDPEMKRKRRVAKYKIYSVEGKMKTSWRKSYKWIKVQCSKIIHGI